VPQAPGSIDRGNSGMAVSAEKLAMACNSTAGNPEEERHRIDDSVREQREAVDRRKDGLGRQSREGAAGVQPSFT